jgi:hypothetical protein
MNNIYGFGRSVLVALSALCLPFLTQAASITSQGSWATSLSTQSFAGPYSSQFYYDQTIDTSIGFSNTFDVGYSLGSIRGIDVPGTGPGNSYPYDLLAYYNVFFDAKYLVETLLGNSFTGPAGARQLVGSFNSGPWAGLDAASSILAGFGPTPGPYVNVYFLRGPNAGTIGALQYDPNGSSTLPGVGIIVSARGNPGRLPVNVPLPGTLILMFGGLAALGVGRSGISSRKS